MKKIAALQQQRAEQQQQAAAAQVPSSSNILQVRQEHCSSVQLQTLKIVALCPFLCFHCRHGVPYLH